MPNIKSRHSTFLSDSAKLHEKSNGVEATPPPPPPPAETHPEIAKVLLKESQEEHENHSKGHKAPSRGETIKSDLVTGCMRRG